MATIKDAMKAISLLWDALTRFRPPPDPGPSPYGTPPDTFLTDGCSLVPDFDCAHVCVQHDWDCRHSKTRQDYAETDARFYWNLRRLGHTILARIYYAGVKRHHEHLKPWLAIR